MKGLRLHSNVQNLPISRLLTIPEVTEDSAWAVALRVTEVGEAIMEVVGVDPIAVVAAEVAALMEVAEVATAENVKSYKTYWL
jgi:hypothetical protein